MVAFSHNELWRLYIRIQIQIMAERLFYNIALVIINMYPIISLNLQKFTNLFLKNYLQRKNNFQMLFFSKYIIGNISTMEITTPPLIFTGLT